MARFFLALLMGVLAFTACAPKAPPPAPPLSPADHAKTTLTLASENGIVGSDVLALRSYFEGLKKTEPAKGEALLKDLDALIQVGAGRSASPKVKAKAKEMLGKL